MATQNVSKFMIFDAVFGPADDGPLDPGLMGRGPVLESAALSTILYYFKSECARVW